MTAFDETLFRVVPALYRSMDHAVAGADSGSVPTEVPAFLRFGSWVGRRPGRQPVRDRAGHPGGRDHPGRSRAARLRAGRLPGRPVPDPARGRDAAVAGPAARAGRGRTAAHPELLGGDHGPLAAGAVPHLPAVRRGAAGGDPQSPRRPGLLRPGGVHRRPAPGPGIPGRRRGPSAGVRRGPAPHLAGGDVRLPPRRAGDSPAQRGARPGPRRVAGRSRRCASCRRRPRRCSRPCAWPPGSSGGSARRRAGGTWSASPGRPGTSPPCTSWPGWPCRTATPRCWTWCRCSRAGRTWPTHPAC